MLSGLAAYASASASSNDTSSTLCVSPMVAAQRRRRPAPLDTTSLQSSVPTGFGFASTSSGSSWQREPVLLLPSGTNYETLERTATDGSRRIALVRGEVQAEEEACDINVPRYVEDAEQDGQAPPQYERVITPSDEVHYQPTAVQITLPSRLSTLLLGTTRAQKAAVARAQRQARRIDEAHAAWSAIGIDTRSLVAQGEPLPPHFFSPPRCHPALLESVIKKEFGL